MGTVLKDAQGVFKFIGQLFVDIVKALWDTDKQMLMTDAVNIFHAEGVAIQDEQPGLGTQAFINLLISTATPLLIGDLAALGIADINIVAATVAKDLSVLDAGGNAGTVVNNGTTTTTSTTTISSTTPTT